MRKRLLPILACSLLLLLFTASCRKADGRPHPVLLIGLDGASWKVIDPMLEAGKLPNLKRLIETGTRGRLQPVHPMLSPLVWTSIATGKTADKHGITDWTTDGKPVASNLRRTKAVWNILSENDLSVGINGYLVTWPAEKINGYNISYRAYYAPDYQRSRNRNKVPTIVYPADRLKEYGPFWVRQPHSEENYREMERFIDWEFNPNYEDLDPESPEYMINFLLDKRLVWVYPRDESTLRLALLLQKDWPTDFTAIYFQGIDFVSHAFWKYTFPEKFPQSILSHSDRMEFDALERTIPAYYEYMDECLGKLLSSLDPSTDIIVLSDHGFQEWLLDPTQKDYPHWYLSGNHATDAVLIMNGPDFKRGYELAECSVLDITPTILYLFDLPVADDMDGKALLDAITEPLRSERSVKTTATYDTEETDRTDAPQASSADEEELERLRALGYIK